MVFPVDAVIWFMYLVFLSLCFVHRSGKNWIMFTKVSLVWTNFLPKTKYILGPSVTFLFDFFTFSENLRAVDIKRLHTKLTI